MFSLIYNSSIFYDLVYRGWLITDDKAIMEAWVRSIEAFRVDESMLLKGLNEIKKNIDSKDDISLRFDIIARFFSKELMYKPSEEKFILLWTILEIYPMKNTTNIKPISEEIAKIIARSQEIVKEKLAIGELYGYRCDLVHNGKFIIDIKEMGAVFTKLEEIILVILKNISGLPYNGILDKYFNC